MTDSSIRTTTLEWESLPGVFTNLSSSMPSDGFNQSTIFSVGLIDRRFLFGECLTAALQAADPGTHYQRQSSISEWLRDCQSNPKALTVLCVSADSSQSPTLALERSIAELKSHDPTLSFAVLSDEDEENPV